MNRSSYLLVVAVGLLVGAAEYALHYRGLVFPDALDYAQMARETASGRPLRTLIARPYTIAAGGHDPFIDTSRPPLHPLSLGAWYAVVGHGEFQAAAFSAIMWLATGLAVYAFARRLLGRGQALAVGLLFLITPSLLPYVWSGMSETPYMLLVILGFTQLATRSSAIRHGVIGGVLVGAACLVRGIGILVLPWALILGWTGSAQTRGARIALISAVAAPLIVWVLSQRVAGVAAPLSFNLAQLPMFTESYPRYSLFRMATPIDPIPFALAHPGELGAKFWNGLRVYGVNAVKLLPIPATLAWIAAAVVPTYDRALFGLRRIVLGLLATHVIVLPFYEPTPRLLVPLIPFLLTLGVAEVSGIARTNARRLVFAVWFALSVVSLHGWSRRPGVPPLRFTDTEAATLLGTLGTDHPIVTDAPWRTAWELGLRSVWIPQDEGALRRVERKLGKLGGFLLTPALPAMDPAERPVFWMGVRQGTTWPHDYHRVRTGFEPELLLGRKATREHTP